MFGNQLSAKWDQGEPKRTTDRHTVIWSPKSVRTFMIIAKYGPVLNGCRHRIALKFCRVVLNNVWMKLAKFQTSSSKFIFMTGMNLVHSPKKVVCFNYYWSPFAGNWLPNIINENLKSNDVLIERMNKVHSSHKNEFWASSLKLC